MNIFSNLIINHSQALHSTIATAIRHSMMMAYARSAKLGKTPQEPDFVAALVLDGSPIIGTHLNAICMVAGGSAKLSGVFCHGKPEVEYPNTACELGDILFAHFHTDPKGQTTRNALLLQAKMSQSLTHPVSKSELPQLNLYLKWPRFSYKRTSPMLNGKTRNVTPKVPHKGAQYLLIDSAPPASPQSGISGMRGAFPMGVSPAMPMLNANNSLSCELIEYLIGSSGRVFEDRQAKGNDWSAVVWDLIEYSVANTFNRIKQSGLKNQPRNVITMVQDDAGFVSSGDNSKTGIIANLFNKSLEDWIGGGKNIPPDNIFGLEGSGGERGLSMILIETTAERQPESPE